MSIWPGEMQFIRTPVPKAVRVSAALETRGVREQHEEGYNEYTEEVR